MKTNTNIFDSSRVVLHSNEDTYLAQKKIVNNGRPKYYQQYSLLGLVSWTRW